MPGPMKTKTAESGPPKCSKDQFKTDGAGNSSESRVRRPRGATIIKKSDT
jgi:hypothetical protein